MNRYSKLIKVLKENPTNNIGGLYSLNPPGFRVGPKDPQLKIYPDIDGNFTDGIPGNPGDPFYLRPAGYWNGGSDWTTEEIPDASQDYLLEDPTGKSTADLIAEDGTVKTFLPPNSRSFILGPLVDGYVPNHGYDNYSNIGYIQKDTRQFVLLARIQGQFIDGLHQEGARVWDGTSGQLTIYNANFTLAMAEWFKDQLTAGTFTSNVPYFYSGGVPQRPQSPAECPNCPPDMYGGATPGTGGGFGTGTPPKLGTQQGPPTSGGPDDAGYPSWGNPGPPRPPVPPVPQPPQPPPPEPEDTKRKPKGSLLAGFAAIDSAIAAEAGLGMIMTAGAILGWIASQLYSIVSAVLGMLFAKYEWTPEEATALRNYGQSAANRASQTLNAELSNEEWEKNAQRGRERDAQNAKEANERSRKADEELKKARESGNKERIRRAEEAERNAERNQERVRRQNAENNRQRAKERRERGLVQPAPRPNVGMYNSYTPSLKRVQSLILEQEAVQPTTNTDTSTQSSSSSDDTKFGGGGRVEYSETLNPTVSWLSAESDYFVGGYVEATLEYGKESVDQLVKGTNLSTETIINLNTNLKEANSKVSSTRKAANDYWNNVAEPNITKLLAEIDSIVWRSSGDWAAFNKSMAIFRKIDEHFDEHDRLENENYKAGLESDYAYKNMGRYIKSGRLLTRQEIDPFSLDDPNVGSEKKDEKDKQEQINKLIAQLETEADEYRQAALMNKLKAYGLGALTAGAVVLGAAILAKPAIVGAIGMGTIRVLKSLIKGGPKPGLGPKPTSSLDKLLKNLGPTPGRTPTMAQQNAIQEFQRQVTSPSTLKKASEAISKAPEGFKNDVAVEIMVQGKKVMVKAAEILKNKGFQVNSYEPQGQMISEDRKRILREIRKPVRIKKAPTKYKMNFSGKFSPQNTPDKTSSHLSDELAMRANARGQSWRTSDKYWSGYETTEKLNIIQDRVGHGSQAWDMIVEKNADKKGWRDREIQENLNQIAHEKAMLNENPEFESPFTKSGMDIDPTTPKNKKNFDKVNKIKKVMADKNTQRMMSQVAPEYPSNPVPQPDEVTGLNPKLQSGENAAAYYKRLDPISANSMPDAAYPQIDYLKNKSKRLKGFKKFKEEKISKES